MMTTMNGNPTWIGIDPSYSRTGIYIRHKGKDSFMSFSKSGDNYKIVPGLDNAHALVSEIKQHIPSDTTSLIIGIEYPIFSSRSGSILAVLMSKFDSLFRHLSSKYPTEVYYIPSVAIPSLIKIKKPNKTQVVDFTKDLLTLPTRVNHDEASAFLIYYIVSLIKDKRYTKSFYYKCYND